MREERDAGMGTLAGMGMGEDGGEGGEVSAEMATRVMRKSARLFKRGEDLEA